MSEQTLLRTIQLDDRDEAIRLFGPGDSFLRMLKRGLELDQAKLYLVARGETIQILGPGDQQEAAELTERVFIQLRKLLRQQPALTPEDVRRSIESVQGLEQRDGPGNLAVLDGGRHLRPRTDGQARYVQALQENDVVVCVGPAGSGKSFLAVSMAVTMLRRGEVKRIVLVRPAVEAGERLGYLPGDLVAKINPYLRPLFDALNDMMEPEQVQRYLENDIIEVAPLAYMRGRTLNNAAIILDEGQNATVAQMKMFLTRMGHGSKIFVTGDMTQIDLPPTTRSGLIDAVERLKGIDRLAIVRLDEGDIVRNPLVQKIVAAYEEHGSGRTRK